MKGRGFPHSSSRVRSPLFLQREARAYQARLVRNFATVFAYDSGRERETQARATRETPERVAVRVGQRDAAPLDYGRHARRAGLFPTKSDFRAALLAALRRRAPARRDTLQGLRQK